MPDWSNNPYYIAAVNAAKKFGVPVDLFVTQIGQESSFNPNAQNGQAAGIAQFIPSTAAAFNLNPYDPIAALNAAAQYDSQLYAQTGSWVRTMDAYGTTSASNPNLAPAVQSAASLADVRNNPSGMQVFDAFLQGLNPLNWGKSKAQLDQTIASGQGTASQTVGAALSFADLITDVPRMVTIVLGLILIVVGLVALTRGPAVNIVTSSIKEAATS